MNIDRIFTLAAPLLLLVSLEVNAGYGLQDRIQSLRSDSVRVVSSLLLSYDPFTRALDRARRDDYMGGLDNMASGMDDPGLVAIRAEFDEFSAAVLDIDSNHRNVAVMALNHLLHAQAQLVAGASRIYRAQAAADEAAVKFRLHELSEASARMLILYQIRPYGGMVRYPAVQLNEQTLRALDETIMVGMAAFAERPEIQAIARNYRFVRPKLFESGDDFAAHGVHYYLGQNLTRLDKLAVEF